VKLRRLRIWLVLALILLGSGLALVPRVRYGLLGLVRGEPFFGGMPVGYWRAAAIDDERIPAREEARRRRMLQLGVISTGLAEWYQEYCYNQTLEPQSWALAEPGARAVVAELLRDQDPRVRHRGALIVLRMGPAGRELLEPLHGMLGDADPYNRMAAAVAFQAVDSSSREPVPYLVELLRYPDAVVRREATLTLLRTYPSDEEMVQEAMGLLNDPDVWTRLASSALLLRAGRDGGAAETLTGLLDDPNIHVRRHAIGQLLESLASGRRDLDRLAVPVLCRGLSRPDIQSITLASEMLAKLGKDAEPAVPILRGMLDDPRPVVHEAVTDALKRIEAEGAAVKSR
jgi:HEAT repeat protein